MRILAHVEHLLWVAGLLCICYGTVAAVQTRAYARRAQRMDRAAPASANDPDEAIGRIDIPALGLTAPITRDYDVNSLRKGVGHIPATAVPGGLGTVGLAGHRDSFFRPLRKIAPKMDVQLIDITGVYHYVVDSTEIVNPDQVRVLSFTSRPELTLITCFPFDYIGAAPLRFIVHAHLLSVAPDVAKGLVKQR